MKTWVLCFKRRKALEWMIRSRSRWKQVRKAYFSSANLLPRDSRAFIAPGARRRSSSSSNCKRSNTWLSPFLFVFALQKCYNIDSRNQENRTASKSDARRETTMKRIVSVSLGSSRRNHKYVIDAAGEKVELERIGTDGDVKQAIRLIRELDGKVDAIGLGGISMYLYAGGRRYILDEARRIASHAKKTPVVDGAGIKQTIEGKLAGIFEAKTGEKLAGRTALIVSAVERYAMAESLLAAGCRLLIGDLIFALGLPVPLHSLRTLDRVSKTLLPLICRLPIKLLYPTGSKQEKQTAKKATRFLEQTEILTGDFHYIRRFLPEKLDGKVIISNTVTQADRKLLAERGASWLVTASPELGGRSFATNILDALVVAVSGRRPEELTAADYEHYLKKLSLVPRVENLQS